MISKKIIVILFFILIIIISSSLTVVSSAIRDEINKQEERKGRYKDLEKRLKDSGESQISTSDPESRQIVIRNNITEVAYNVQTMVDAKNNIPIDYNVTNQNDSRAMGNMV